MRQQSRLLLQCAEEFCEDGGGAGERNLLSKCTTHAIINLTEVKTLNECCANAIIITDSKWICFVKSKLRKSL